MDRRRVACDDRHARHFRSGRRAVAISDFSAALGLEKIPPLLRALCLNGRATAHRGEGDRKLALNDLDEALRIRDLPGPIVGPAQPYRGVLRGETGDRAGEISDYTKVIDLPDVPNIELVPFAGILRDQNLVARLTVNKAEARRDGGPKVVACYHVIQGFKILQNHAES